MAKVYVPTQMSEELRDKLDDLVVARQKLAGPDAEVTRSSVIRDLINHEYNSMITGGPVVTELDGPEDANRPVLVGMQSGVEQR